jgi:hypothetical protein
LDLEYVAFMYNGGEGLSNSTTYMSRCILGPAYTDFRFLKEPALWIKLANKSIICSAHNTRFTVGFSAKDQTRTISYMGFQCLLGLGLYDGRVLYVLSQSLSIVLAGAIACVKKDGAMGRIWTAGTRSMDTALVALLPDAFADVSKDTQRQIPLEDPHLARNRSLSDMLE